MTSGTSYPIPIQPALVPPPSYIALISTLLVHPSYTTRATSRENLDISTQSLTFLRNILALVGPLNAKLGDAFTFVQGPRSPRRNRRVSRRSQHNGAKSPTCHSEDVIGSSLAGEKSLWTRAQDLWHVVGWAFSCSVNYPKRWEYWRVWLEYMVDLLEADWRERYRLDTEFEKTHNGDEDPGLDRTKDCLLLQYLSGCGSSSTAIKRIVKAILADGSAEATRAYPEIFHNETRELKDRTGTKRKRETKVDLEEGHFGDYLDEDDSPSSSQATIPSSPVIRSEESQTQGDTSNAKAMGGSDAVILRLRLLALVSSAFKSSHSTDPTSYLSHRAHSQNPSPNLSTSTIHSTTS
jgi:hypothetical protein